MTAASQAMGVAVASLEKLKTGEALPPEMEALNHLLKAQADVKERQVTRQQAGSGGGANRATQDMSSLFDRELQRQQQTNYETPTTTERRGDNETSSTLDKIKELARRQDELNARQQALTRRVGRGNQARARAAHARAVRAATACRGTGSRNESGGSGESGGPADAGRSIGPDGSDRSGGAGRPGRTAWTRSAPSGECTGTRRRAGRCQAGAATSAVAGRVRGNAERGQRPAAAGRGGGSLARRPCRRPASRSRKEPAAGRSGRAAACAWGSADGGASTGGRRAPDWPRARGRPRRW